MNKILLLLFVSFLMPVAVMAQFPYVGIQNSQRKGIISAMMNPAEMNNLSRTVEVQFFAGNAVVGNNTLTFSETLENRNDLWSKMMEKADQPVDGNTDGSVIIPSFGMKKGKWAFGLISQVQTRATILNINPEIGRYVTDNEISFDILTLGINNPNNQRANTATWFETGVVIGREIWNSPKSKFSVGTNFKLLFPTGYTNLGIGSLRGTLVVDQTAVALTNAQATVNISYDESVVNKRNFSIDYENLSFGQLSGVGFDIGFNYQLKNKDGVWLNTGMAFRNIGNLTLGAGQNNQTFKMNIPEGQSFRIDLLEPDLRAIERDFLESGYFSRESNTDGIKAGLPTVWAANADLKLSDKFFVSVYGQTFLQNKENNLQIPAMNLIALTPSAVFGKFEVYSSWGYYDIAGFTGGLGFRFGGFFIGSQSILTALMADTKKADLQVGLSWGFGKKITDNF
ncbi:DUF5723 family protein [Cognataquiflexum rubidum]|uniref:DUF5723 family protein n=1 Tax=Cognataquiflexum rubidum TaxID=2922273 RepID=UPI001F1437A6|nr:DUF5723 family protein [Cognataquiflexum rubidum]MCH6233104.1 DUF5723 family protein [Cognataquiflexum rubidum]